MGRSPERHHGGKTARSAAENPLWSAFPRVAFVVQQYVHGVTSVGPCVALILVRQVRFEDYLGHQASLARIKISIRRLQDALYRKGTCDFTLGANQFRCFPSIGSASASTLSLLALPTCDPMPQTNPEPLLASLRSSTSARRRREPIRSPNSGLSPSHKRSTQYQQRPRRNGRVPSARC